MKLKISDNSSYNEEEKEALAPFMLREINFLEELVQIMQMTTIPIALDYYDPPYLVIDHPFSW